MAVSRNDQRPVTLRKSRKPVAAILIIAFLIVDIAKLHLLHHLLGAISGLVAFLLFTVAVCWGAWRLKRRSEDND